MKKTLILLSFLPVLFTCKKEAVNSGFSNNKIKYTADTITFRSSGSNIDSLVAIYIPNAFTPDGDGINDVFLVKGVNIAAFSMKITDRWGSLLFSSNDINIGWYGTYKNQSQEADDGIYNYQIEITDKIFGKTYNYSGEVVLLR